MSDLKHIIIYPSYRCNLSCDYCWVYELGWKENEHPLSEWLQHLPVHETTVLNIVGGEPTLLSGLYDFCNKFKGFWAITTNLQDAEFIERIIAKPLKNCVQITLSWKNNLTPNKFNEYFSRLQTAGYRVGWSYVSPDQAPPKELKGGNVNFRFKGEIGKGRLKTCNVGINHVVIGANGDIYPCQAWFMRHENKMGNLFTDGLVWLKENLKCNLACLPCYVEGQFGILWNEL